MQIALSKNEITPTSFYEKNDILKFEELQKEVGYKKMEDGSYLVSMYCPMPNITSEMIEWWFWWHPKKNERYQVWFPKAHFSIGFSKSIMQENDIPLIVCGHVGAFYGLIWHTEMAHIFKQTEDGLFMISRFWLGKTMKNPLLRKRIITDKMAKGMAEHCCVEYRNLLEILPILYCEE